MFIVPINSYFGTGLQNDANQVTKIANKFAGGVNTSGTVQNTSDGAEEANGFKNLMNDLISNVETTEKQTKLDAYNLSVGNMDDLHTMTINATKYEVALQTMVELRNKMLEAYTEVMRTNL